MSSSYTPENDEFAGLLCGFEYVWADARWVRLRRACALRRGFQSSVHRKRAPTRVRLCGRAAAKVSPSAAGRVPAMLNHTAGADGVLSYFAPRVAEKLRQQME